MCYVYQLKCTVFILPLLYTSCFVTNGEFNYIRGKAYMRPLSVLQICTDVHKTYNKIKAEILINILTPEEI